MNRLQYRIVFNKQRGQLMAVAETVRSQSKAAGQTGHPSLRAVKSADGVEPTACGPPSLIAIAAAFAVGAVLTLLPVPPAQAQVKADPNAPKNQQPTVLTAPNGTPLVNIQTPSSSGVSRNTYSQFDVNGQGVILNNSRTDTSTQLGGWVQGNPWMAKGEARVILNEVNSSAPSQLKGYVEVAGRRAEVIIANPAGIQVDGGGFINASSATLTTGTPRFDAAGHVTGFGVQGGLIRIDGAGLDGSQTDYTALLARAVELNAGFWAKEARIQTGTEVMPVVSAGGADAGQGAGEALAPTGERPRYALDSTALGGIYAQRITLVGTEAGLGVRQAGQMVGGQLKLDVNGWLDNSGTLYAQDGGADALHVNATSGVHNSGTMAARGSTTVSGAQLQGEAESLTAAGLNEDGTLVVGSGTLSLRAGDSLRQSGQMLAGDRVEVQAKAVDVSGASVQGRQVSLQGDVLRADGAQLASTGAMQLQATGGLFATQAALQAGDLTVSAATLQLEKSELSSAGTLTLTTSGLLNTRGALVAGDLLQITAGEADNQGGEWLHLGAQRFNATVAGTLTMTGGRLATNAQDMTVNAGQLTGAQASLEHYGTGVFSVTAASADLGGAQLTSYGTLDLQTQSLQLDAVDALVRAVHLQADTVSLRQALVRSASTASVTGAVIDHRGGQLVGDQGVSITASTSFLNDGGQIHAASGSVDITGDADISNRAGVLAAQGTVSVAGVSLTQANGASISGKDVKLQLRGSFSQDAVGADTASSSVAAARDLNIQADTMTQAGVMRAGNALVLSVAQTAALGGSIYSQGSLQLHAGGAVTVNGLLGAQESVTATASRFTTSATSTVAAGLGTDGQINTSGALNISAADELRLAGLQLAGHALLQGARLDLTSTQLSTGSLMLRSGGALITEGATLQTGQLGVQATDWRNSGGKVAVSGTESLQVTLVGNLNNRQGSLQTNSAQASLTAASVDNTGGVISTSGGLLSLQADHWQNQSGVLAGAGAVTARVGELLNADGQWSGQILTLDADRLSNVGSGLISASQTLQVDAGELHNSGTLYSHGNLGISSRGVLENSGLIRGFGVSTLQADQLLQGGTVASQGNLTATAREISSAGTWAAGLQADNTWAATGNLTLSVQDSLQHSGTAIAAGLLQMTGAQLQLQGSQARAREVALLSQGDLRLDHATMAVNGVMSLGAQSTLNTEGASLSAADVTLAAADWRHAGGTLSQTAAAGRLQVDVAGQLDNTGGKIEANAATVDLRAATLNNAQGSIMHAGAGGLRLAVGTLYGARGELLSNGALTLTANGGVDVSNARVQAQQVVLAADSLQNQAGQITGVVGVQLTVAQRLDNTSGLLQSGGDLRLQAGTLENRDGQIDGEAVHLSGSDLSNTGQGLVNARQALHIEAGQFTSTGSLQAGDTLSVSTEVAFVQGGLLYAQRAVTVQAGGLLTQTGLLASADAVTLHARDLAGSGQIVAGLRNDNTLGTSGDLTVVGTGAVQHSGQFLAAGALSVTGASLSLQGSQSQAQAVAMRASQGDLRLEGGAVITSGLLDLQSNSTLDSSGAALSAASVNLQAQDWRNIAGQLAQTDAAGILNVAVQGLIQNQDGRIAGNVSDLTLQASQINNTHGAVVHAGAGVLTLRADQLDGSQGQILSAGSIALSVTGAADLSAATTQGQGITLEATSLNHQGGQWLSAGGTRLAVTGAMDNTHGQIQSAADVVIHAGNVTNQDGQLSGQMLDLTTGTLNNGANGLALAQRGLTLTVDRLTNVGSLQSQGTLALNVTGTMGNAGQIYSQADAIVSVGGVLTHSGLLAAQGSLTVSAGAINSAGVLAAGLKPDSTLAGQGHLSLQAQQTLQHSGATIAAGQLDVSGAALQLQNSQIQGQSVHLTAASGGLQMDHAIVASGGDLTLHSLAGMLVTDDATLSGASVNLRAQDWRNLGGTVGQLSASGQLVAEVAGSLNNERGAIEATGGALTLTAQSITNSDGRIAQAAAGALTVRAGSLQGQQGELLTNGTLTLQANGAVSLAQALTQARDLSLTAASLDHQGGQLLSTGTANLQVQGQVNNTGGTMVSGALMDLHAGSLVNNTGGLMQSGGGLQARVDGTLENQGGRLRSGGDLLITSARLDNRGGEVGSDRTLTAQITGDLLNTGGNLIAQRALTVTASTLGNQHGQIASLQDGVTMTTQGQLDNTGGLVQAQGGLKVRTNGGALINARDAAVTTSTGIHAQGGMTIEAGALSNESGISAAAGASLTSSSLTNRGEISSGTTLQLITAGTLNNQGGRLISLGTLDATGQQVLNQGGLLYGGQTLTVQAATLLDNINTSGTGQGLQGGAVTLRAEQVDNRAGQVLANGDLQITAHQWVNNSGGQLGAGGRQVIGDGGAVSASALLMNNVGGRVWSGGDFNLTARQLADGVAGQISSGGNLGLSLQGDLTYGAGSQLASTGNTVLTVTGNFTNQGVLRSGGTLSVSAAKIDNQASGELSGVVTLLSAGGSLTNRGLIDGDGVSLTAGQLINVGTGRIYGGDIVLTGGSLTNDAENGQAAVIAGRYSLDGQFTGDINNRNGALIFADGGLQITGQNLLNENATIQASDWLVLSLRGGLTNSTVYEGMGTGQGAGQGVLASKAFISSGGDMAITAGSLLNSGATIEGRGNLTLVSADIKNVNPYLKWTVSTSAGEPSVMISYYMVGQLYEDRSITIKLNGRNPDDVVNDFIKANDDRRLERYFLSGGTTTAVTQSSAAQIIVGGILTVVGGTITNDMSRVVGANGVSITADTVNNVAHTVQSVGTDGTVTQVTLTLPTSASSVVPNASQPGVRTGAGAVTTEGGATGQAAQSAGRAGGLPGLLQKALHQVDGASGADTNANVNTAWRAGESADLLTVDQAQGAAQSMAATAEQREGRSLLISALRNATATQTDGQADGTTRAAVAAEAVRVAGATNAAQPAAARTTTLRGAAATFNGKPLARSVTVNLTVPNNSLFKLHSEATSNYLVETDPRFANYRDWLSSDYLLEQLAMDPATTQKRLGDGFYEQRLVREQIGELTGTSYLAGYASDEEMYRALLSNGASFAKEHQLIPGVALTAEQMTQLTTDLVWLVEQDVTLADGSVQKVLVPQVYLVPRDGDLQENGALIAGDRVQMALAGDLGNAGTIQGGDVTVQAQNISNTGAVRGTSVALSAREDITNIGGKLAATEDLSLVAGRDISVGSTVASGAFYDKGVSTRSTVLDRVAELSAGGVMVLQAGQDVSLQAAQLKQGSEGQGADGGIVIQAGRDVNLSTVELSKSTSEVKNANNYRNESLTQDSGTTIDAQGLVAVQAGQDVVAKAATLSSAQGSVQLLAGRDVQLLAGEANQVIEQMTQKKKSGFLKKKTTTTYTKTDETVAVASTVSGSTVEVRAGQDIGVLGSNVVSDAGTSLVAGRDVVIEGVTNTLESESFSKTVKSGLMSGGGIGFTVGKQSLAQTKKSTEETNAGATVASVQGDVSIVAGEAYKQVGSAVSAPAGDVSVVAKSIDIEEARNTSVQNSETKFKQSGVTVSISAPGVSAALGAVSAGEHLTQTEDDRMKALAAATAISKAMQAQKEIAALSKSLEEEKGKESISVSISVGSSKSTSNQVNQADQAAGSTVVAGGSLSLTATGADKDSNVTVRGSSLTGQDVIIQADNAIHLEAASNSNEQHSTNKSSSASVGVGFSLGADSKVGVTVSGSVSKGNSDGVDTSYTTTEVKGGNSVRLESGGDTSLKGAVVTAPQVAAKVGGDLKVESLQDTATFDSKSTTVSGSATFTGPALTGASASYSQSKVSADYAAVGAQAGIRAGDGGFNVEVAGNTDLKGGAITSSQAAIDAGKNAFSTGTLTSTDIQNRSQYSATAVTVSAGTSGGMAGAYKDSGDERSTTQSTISAGATTITSGDAASLAALEQLDRGATNDATAGKLAQGWDGQKLAEQAKLNAQIVADFGAQAAKEVGDYAKQQTAKYDLAKLQESAIQDALKKEGKTEDEEQQLKAQLAQVQAVIAEQTPTYEAWKEGGSARVALHAVIGGLTGDLAGALGAAGSALAAPALNDFQTAVKAELVAAGMDAEGKKNEATLADGLAKLAAGLAAGATGAAFGTAGGVAGLNQDFNNRQLHPDQISLVKEEAKKLAGLQGLDEAEWEKRLTQQLLLQNDSAYEAGRNGQGNDALAEQILKNLERESGVVLDYRGTDAYSDHTANTEHLNQTIGSYDLAGVRPSDGIELADGTWQATKPGTTPMPSGGATVTKIPVEGCSTPYGACTYTFMFGSDVAYVRVPQPDGGYRLYQASEAQQTTLAALQSKYGWSGVGEGVVSTLGGLVSLTKELALFQVDTTLGTVRTVSNVVASVSEGQAVTRDVLAYESSMAQWLLSGKAKEITLGDVLKVVVDATPLGIGFSAGEKLSSTDPETIKAGGSEIGAALTYAALGAALEPAAMAAKGLVQKVDGIVLSKVEQVEVPALSHLSEKVDGVPGSSGSSGGSGSGSGSGSGIGAAGKVEESLPEVKGPSGAEEVTPEKVAPEKQTGEATPDAAPKCLTPPNCFVAGTLIHTVDGPKAIETFVGGELVLSRDEFTQAPGVRPVVATVSTEDQPIFEVVIVDADGRTEALQTTSEHPFWVTHVPGDGESLEEGAGTAQWVRAASLEPGMRVIDLLGRDLTVHAQRALERKATVYNIEVHEHHTYHVGGMGVWVHNAPCCEVGNEGTAANGGISASFSIKQLDKKFKHAEDFGLSTTKKNPETLEQYQAALEAHLNDAATYQHGTYQYVPDSVVYFNSTTNNVIVLSKGGEFVTGWKLTPGSPQFENFLKNWILR
ncbi:hemagglutinin repeat-containing protein [Roseateles sp. SL47]|uniref:two-partner secretion domain-containing protein n=1 Tax=Roseateles sp. SL47 TaxID=2995138 RepID=UPI00226FF3CE|nr:hemagglutinin repeat-containing protein [Roseateles sp. SL47]WAC71209.1 hemagglutinin repeat-containing protein [Roseateles sp. SL47]